MKTLRLKSFETRGQPLVAHLPFNQIKFCKLYFLNYILMVLLKYFKNLYINTFSIGVLVNAILTREYFKYNFYFNNNIVINILLNFIQVFLK